MTISEGKTAELVSFWLFGVVFYIVYQQDFG